MNASRVIIRDEDYSYQALGALKGISGFIGTFRRGPIADPSILITSAQQLRSLYGGPITGSDDYILAERVLTRGGKLRIVNVRNYTDPTDPSTLTATKAGDVTVTGDDPADPGQSTVNIFKLSPKYPGADYNNLKAVISTASNGQTLMGYFNLTIYIEGDEFYTTETYQNLRVPDRVTVADQTWLSDVLANSQLVVPSYLDLSGIGGTDAVVPSNGTKTFTGGSNGSAVVPADIIGNQAAGTGIYALDAYDDMYDFAAPSITETSVHIAGANYAAARGDIEYLAHLSHNLKTPAALISARAGITVDSKYYSVFSGGVIISDPVTGERRAISEVADVMGIGAYVDENFNPWFSQSNYTRGFIPNAIDVNYNLGSSGAYPQLNQLANRQINMVVAANGLIYLKGNFSGQFGSSLGSFRHVTRLLIYIKKTLKPILEKYLDEPNEFTTWRNLYDEVKPFLQSLKDGRATHSIPKWQGDQDATKLSDLKVNKPSDIDAGKYRVLLTIDPVGTINELTLVIGISSSGIDFEDPTI